MHDNASPLDPDTAIRPPLGTPSSHLQRMECLRVATALHHARVVRDVLASAPEPAVATRAASIARADKLLSNIPWRSPEKTAYRLTDALVWAHESEVADQRLSTLMDHYATTAGLRIDPDNLTVTVDPDFDAAREQQFQMAATAASRAITANDMLASTDMPPQVRAALAPELPDGITPANAPAYLEGARARQQRLDQALFEHTALEPGNNPISAVVDYLHGDTRHLDLLAVERLVDVGIDARGRVDALLADYADAAQDYRSAVETAENPDHDTLVQDTSHDMAWRGSLVATEIRVMTPEDRQRVRAAGRAIVNGRHHDGNELWPDHVDRDRLAATIHEMARTARQLTYHADWLTTEPEEDLGGDVPVLLGDLGRARDELHAALDSKGLHPLERAALVALEEDIDAGTRDDRNLPELLLLDERSKREADMTRLARDATAIGKTVYTDVRDLLRERAGVDLKEDASTENLHDALNATATHVEYLAHGGHSPQDLRRERKHFDTDLTKLGNLLVERGVGGEQRRDIKAVIDAQVVIAAEHARQRDAQDQVWRQRLHGVTDAERPDRDNPAQRAIAASCATPAARACATRPTTSTARPAGSVGASGRIQRLHEGIDR